MALSEGQRRDLGRKVEGSIDRVFGQAFVSCFLHVLAEQVEHCAKHECLGAQGPSIVVRRGSRACQASPGARPLMSQSVSATRAAPLS
ncbi:hypothetical protein [Luteococcus japonicus]|uniref:hypothetical protein n=1 Tax=Luteococcus japonicus TaxID=33984 RepID=UPI0011CECC32|nr:hypothetical protein [Luteococcus japonicus]